MTAQTPEEAHKLFVRYYNEQEIESLVALYEPNAVLIQLPSPPARGHEAIRLAVKGFFTINGQMELTIDKVFQADDLAILFSSWTINGTDRDGTPVKRTGQTSDVVRRQADGSWLFVIDNPHGAAATTSTTD